MTRVRPSEAFEVAEEAESLAFEAALEAASVVEEARRLAVRRKRNRDCRRTAREAETGMTIERLYWQEETMELL